VVGKVSNEQTTETMSPEERARVRKQLGDQAVKLAISSRWDEAVAANREYLRLFGDDPDAYNRLGKALTELGQVTDARQSYSRALEVDPTNTIAKRNLDRLASLKDSAIASAPPTQVDTRLFIEETGKAASATLQAVESKRAALLDAGDMVELRVEGNAVNVHAVTGEYVGMVEPRIGLRLASLMNGGNTYTAAIVSTSGEMKVIIRETYRHPSQISRVSFPQSRATTDVRPYTRRNLLRGEQDEVDYSEDDEVEDEEVDDGWTETDSDGEVRVEVSVDNDEDSFD
jgi:hypothetical protein